jgi:ubiquitin carboxyl-terminal hydrolase 8
MKGLHNLGNTCFLNSCLQIFFEIPELKAAYQSQIQTNLPKEPTIYHALYYQWNTLASASGPVANPLDFIKCIHRAAQIKGIEVFTGWAQNDVGEFIRFLLDCFHTCLQRKVKVKITGETVSDKDKLAKKCYQILDQLYRKEYSEIIENFYGISISEIKQHHNIMSQTPEMYFILDLPIPITEHQVSLYDCFDLYIREEQLTGANAWHNDATGNKEAATKQLKFWNFPKILIIALKRFQVSRTHVSKIDRYIQYPERGLNLSRYVEEYFPDKYVYDLFGVCNHMGSVAGGHCTSIVKPRDTPDAWFLCDDARVQQVQNSQSQYAYVLFYRRR